MTMQMPWIHVWNSLGCVKLKPEEKKPGIKPMNTAKACIGQARSKFTDPLMEDSSGYLQMDSSNARLEDNSGWELLGVEEVLTLLERMAIRPSVENFICILHKCKKGKNPAYAKRIYKSICDYGLECHRVLGNHLIPMFVECGSLSDAEQIFGRLVHRNQYSWTSLMEGYIQCGEYQQVVNMFQEMQDDCVHPSKYMFVALLKASAKLKCIDVGRKVHTEVAKSGFERDPFVGNTLVDMYAKCGSLVEARQVLDQLPVQDRVSWTALMAGYSEQGLGQEALNCFHHMILEGISLDSVTFVCSLKACGNIGALDEAREIHVEIVKHGHEKDRFVGNTLVDMYAKCGSLAEALEVFEKLPVQDVVSWTAVISGFMDYGLGEEALNCVEQMQVERVPLNVVTFLCTLKACGSVGAIDRGRDMHTDIIKQAFEKDLFLGSTLVDMYMKCNSLVEAQDVFDKLPGQNVVAWNALLAGYGEHGLGEEGLDCLEQMQVECKSPDAVTLVCGMKACCSIGAIDKGWELHTKIAKEGFERISFVGNTLVDMYAKCDSLAEAQDVFNKLPVRDVVSWNALIAGYVENSLVEEAVSCLRWMQVGGMSPDAVSFMCSLKACGSKRAIDRGRGIHSEIAKAGFESDPCVGNALVDMYAKCASLSEAWEVFDKLSAPDVVSWTAIITGYSEHGLSEEALNCLEWMQLEGVSPNLVTFVSALKGCFSTVTLDRGREIHLEIAKQGFERDPCVGRHLVCMYAKCGLLAEAQEVFDKLSIKDVISWNVLIAEYTEHGLDEEALNCLHWMQLVNTSPDAITCVCGLKASGSIGTMDKGREIHMETSKHGFEREPFVGSALVDMYAKCGSLSEAREVFDKLPVRDAVLWTALMSGYVRLGDSESVFHLYERMKGEGIMPDEITFLSLLTVCSHVGLVDKGQKYFEAMNEEYGITPTVEHHNCVVDLLGRAGQFDEAVAMLENMPFEPNLVTWNTLLGACQKWGAVELGREAFECVVASEDKHAPAFILMSNIYADAYMWEDVKNIEAML